MANSTNFKTDIALLVARIGIGGMMLLHGIAKISGGIGGIKEMLVAKGLPEMLAYGVYVGEIIVPAMLVLGLATRPAALVFIANMVFAIALAHGGDVFSLGAQGGWAIELPALYILGALVILILGAGKFSVPCPICKLLKNGKCACGDGGSCN